MSERKRFLAIAITMICGALLAITTHAQRAKNAEQPAKVHELPPEMMRRFSDFHSKLQPTARTWVEQQARVEAQKTAPDEAGLVGAIRNRFPELKTVNINLANNDINTIVFLVMMEAAKSAQDDLKSIMDGVKETNAAKDELRQMQMTINKIMANEAGGGSKNKLNAECKSPFCESLSEKLGELRKSTAGLSHPVRLQAPAHPTYGNLQGIQNQLKNELDSMSELGETESLRLQMAMDRVSKFMQTLSNIEKKMSDTASSIVQNMK